jgi:hypothetical protein
MLKKKIRLRQFFFFLCLGDRLFVRQWKNKACYLYTISVSIDSRAIHALAGTFFEGHFRISFARFSPATLNLSLTLPASVFP